MEGKKKPSHLDYDAPYNIHLLGRWLFPGILFPATRSGDDRALALLFASLVETMVEEEAQSMEWKKTTEEHSDYLVLGLRKRVE